MEPEDENRLFVGKIPAAVPNEDIERYFARFGTVLHFMFPRPTGSLKIAFVTYATKQALDKALEIPHQLGGMELNVTKALPKTARGQAPAADAKQEARIFIGQLPASTTEEEVIGYFSKYGTITKVHFPPQTPDKDKMYGFVTFSSPQEKFAALAASHIFKGVEIRVVEAMPKGLTDRPRGISSRAANPPAASNGSTYFASSAPIGRAPSGPPFPGAPVLPPASSSSSSSSSSSDFDENPVRLFVGRLPADATPEELRDYFSRYGTVADVFMPGRGGKGKPEAKGSAFAFVTFSQSRELFKALADAPHTFKDTQIEVVEARPKGAPGSGSAAPQTEPRVFVGRISSELTDAQLRDYFGSFGRVVDVYRPKQHSKDGFDFAFVIFTSQQEVARVLAEDKHIIGGKYELNVIRARPRNSPPGAPAQHEAPPPGRNSGRGQRDFGEDIYAPRSAGRGPVGYPGPVDPSAVQGYPPAPVDPAYLGQPPSYEMYPGQPQGFQGYPSPAPPYDPYGGQGLPPPPAPYGVGVGGPPPPYGSLPPGYGAAPSAPKHQRYAPY